LSEAALACGTSWQTRSWVGSARLAPKTAVADALRQELPIMDAIPSQQRLAIPLGVCAIGIAVCWLATTPFGLLAPIAALFLFARGRAVLSLHAALIVGLAASLVVAAFHGGAAHDLAVTWAAFFALALCIGAIVAPASLNAEAMPAAIQSPPRQQAPSYPVAGPTLQEKAAPRHAPYVSISAQEDKTSAALLGAASFWGGTPFRMRYWRRQPDASYRWVESRSEPFREPSGTRLWSSVTADVDDQRLGQEPPTKIASNPRNDSDAVRAAKFVENLLGNAWAFDAAGRPTYLTPLAQTFVAVTLEEFQAAVDEGHTFFKRTAHPDDYDRIAAAWRRSLQTGDPFFLDRRIRRASGIHEWNRTGFVPTRDRRGRITGWYGSTIDLDSHRIAQAELRDRERELSQLVDMVPSHLWRLTPDGEPIFFSKRMVDFLGLDVADMSKPGTSRLDAMIETVHPNDAAEFRDTLRRCFATGESFTMRYRLRRLDGVYRWMSSHAEPMRDQDGRIVQWYGLCHDIDDQVHAEEALRRSERQLQQLIDAVPAMIWSTTREGTPAYVNKRFIDVIGATVEDITAPDGSPALGAIVHPDDIDETVVRIRESFRSGNPYVMQYRQIRRGGSYRWTETRAEALRDESGEILQWYGVSVDIHDVVTAQEALRDREQELSQLVNMVPVHIRRLTPQGEPTFFNKRLMDFFGLGDVSELDRPGMARLAAAIQSLVHPDDAASLLETARRCFAAGEPFSMKYRMRRADGAYRWVDTRAEPLRNQSEAIVNWYVVSLDIDDEVRTQEALLDRERELSQLVNLVPVYIRRLTPEGEPIFFNRRLTDFIGVDLAQIGTPGMSRLPPAVENFIHPDESAKLLAAIRHSIATGEGYAMKYRMRRADGVYRWLETRAEPVRHQDGTIAQWYVVSIDIDDEVRAQQAEDTLRETSDKLAKATQAASLAELSASIAHEVNQPLAAIVANSHACQRWLSANPANVERAKMTVERIIDDANAAADVVSRIRALFRQSVKRDGAKLPSVIAEAYDLMADEASRRRVVIDMDVESDLPLVPFDRVQIQQVLINLVRNGMDAMDATVGDRVVGMRVRRAGDVVRAEISDHGRGVEFPDKIFEPFFTTKESGMGMGLAICRSIVESHGGRLWAEKNEPHGARFIFTLPVEAKPAQ
jgi:PAS domain S-box-containing protein